jgi:hypothetical protein
VQTQCPGTDKIGVPRKRNLEEHTHKTASLRTHKTRDASKTASVNTRNIQGRTEKRLQWARAICSYASRIRRPCARAISRNEPKNLRPCARTISMSAPKKRRTFAGRLYRNTSKNGVRLHAQYPGTYRKKRRNRQGRTEKIVFL